MKETFKFLSFQIIYILITIIIDNAKCASVNQPLLHCEPDSIKVNITKSYLKNHNIYIRSINQLFFRNHENCFANEDKYSYTLTLFAPFEACGTVLDHTTEDYIYTNEVVLDRRDGNGAAKLLEIRCVYEDKYVVSSGPITPTKNTLSFQTEYGNFSTDMTLYDSDRFDLASKMVDRPSIVLAQKVYVGINLYIPFNKTYNNDFAVTVTSCFANHDSSHKDMSTFHFLIAGMCAKDKTVEIYQNGLAASNEARFSFEMFKFKKSTHAYLYLHCEVKLCNHTAEVCSGATNPICDKIPDATSTDSLRKRRSLPHLLPHSINKRDINEDIPNPNDGKLAYLSRGPLIISSPQKETNSEKSKITLNVLNDTRKEQSYLRLWVISGVSAVIGIIGIILTAITAYNKRKQRMKQAGITTNPKTDKNEGLQGQWRTGPLPQVPTISASSTKDLRDLGEDNLVE